MTNIDIRKALASQFGGSYHVGSYPVLNKISTGIIGLDLILGGGLPVGRVIQVWGGSSACKTTVCLHFAKTIQALGLECAFVDAERTLTDQRIDDLGIDKQRFHLFLPSCGEQALEFAVRAAEAGIKLIIIDSVPFLNTKAAAESDVGATQMAPQARLLAAEMPKLIPAIEQNDCILLFINQMRSKIGGYGDPTSLPGGNALRYMSSVILKLSRTELFKDGSGLRIAAQTTKNKYFPEGKKCEFTVNFPSAQIDQYSSMKEVLEQQGLLIRRGAYYKFEDSLSAELGVTGNIGQGVASVMSYFREHSEAYNLLYQRLLSSLNKIQEQVEEVDPDA